MDKIIIRGGQKLAGSVPVSGAKNAALTLLPCALLTEEPLTLRNLPRLADVDGFQHLMNQFGVSTAIAGARPEDFGRVMTLQATRLTSSTAPYDLVRKMRASILVLGPLLARAGEAVELPARAVTIHALAVMATEGPEEALASATLRAHVSKGTYIRSLARDIALALGSCGHVTWLHREKAGPFRLEQAISLDKLNEIGQGRPLGTSMLPLEAGLVDIPALSLDPQAVAAVRQGRVLCGMAQADGLYWALDGDVPVALVRLEGGSMKVERGFNL